MNVKAKLLILIGTVGTSALVVWHSNKAVSTVPPPPDNAVNPHRQAPLERSVMIANVKSKASEMVKAFADGDSATAAQLTLPTLIDRHGGLAKAELEIQRGFKKSIDDGLIVEFAWIEDPSNLVDTPDGTFALIPYTLIVRKVGSAPKLLQVDVHLVGVSRDGGRTWAFMDAKGRHRDELVRVISDLPEAIQLPKRQNVEK